MKKIQEILEKVKNVNTITIVAFIFLISFFYILFFTQCLPFFFDDHHFNSAFIHRGYKTLFFETFYMNQGLGTTRSTYGLFVSVIYDMFGMDYCAFRLAKAVVFSLVLIVLFYLSLFLFKRRGITFFICMYVMTLFPFYLQTVGYNGPHIIAEFFKLFAILFFLKDVIEEKTSYKRQLAVFFFSLLAVRSYFPAFSIAGMLPLFTLLYDRRKFKQYLLLFFMLLMLQIPLSTNLGTYTLYNPDVVYNPKMENTVNVFLNDFSTNTLNPVPSYNILYYKTFTAIITFFGFWLIVIICFILAWKKIQKLLEEKRSASKQRGGYEITARNDRLICSITIAWMGAELPAYIFLPESAIRYIFAFMIPFALFIALLIMKSIECVKEKWKKHFIAFIFFMIICAMLINVSYVYAFRASWGSAFITFDKGMDYFSGLHETDIGVFYFTGSAAEEYYNVNKSSETYEFATGINYMRSANSEDFNPENIARIATDYNQFYIIKRISSVSKTQYPRYPVEENPNLILVEVLEGYDESILFDSVNKFMMNVLNIEYEPNKIYIYNYSR